MAPLVDRAVVMRDGRVAYDGAPLADHEVHHPDCGEAHAHHHHDPGRTPRPRAARRLAPGPGRADELLTYAFMHRALLGRLFTGLAAPAVGTYLVQRRLALMGDGIGHVAVTGVALGLLTGTSPTLDRRGRRGGRRRPHRGHPRARPHQRRRGPGAAVLRRHRRWLLITGIGGQGAATLQQLPVRLDHHHLGRRRLGHRRAGAVVYSICGGLSPQLFAVAQDQEFAKVAGLNVRFYNLLVAVLAAVTVTVAMRTVGLLLVSALMVVPVATAQQVTRSFRDHARPGDGPGHGGLAGRVVDLGVASARRPWPPGRRSCCSHWPASCSPGRSGRCCGVGSDCPRRSRAGQPDEHEATARDARHKHGDDCGHLAVQHGDHVDYVHDGHRHAPHGKHYDEH